MRAPIEDVRRAYDDLLGAIGEIDLAGLGEGERRRIDERLCHIALSDDLLAEAALRTLADLPASVDNKSAMDRDVIAAAIAGSSHAGRIAALIEKRDVFLERLRRLSREQLERPVDLVIRDAAGNSLSSERMSWRALIALRAERHLPAHTAKLAAHGATGRRPRRCRAPEADMLYAEDLTEGREFQLGSYTIGEEEILTFARQYDPVPIHIDPEAAAAGPFGGLIASGFNTMAIYQRLVVEGVWSKVAGIVGRSFEIRLPNPVRPGSTLTGHSVVQKVTMRPERGDAVMILRTELTDEGNRTVLILTLDVLIRARPRS